MQHTASFISDVRDLSLIVFLIALTCDEPFARCFPLKSFEIAVLDSNEVRRRESEWRREFSAWDRLAGGRVLRGDFSALDPNGPVSLPVGMFLWQFEEHTGSFGSLTVSPRIARQHCSCTARLHVRHLWPLAALGSPWAFPVANGKAPRRRPRVVFSKAMKKMKCYSQETT